MNKFRRFIVMYIFIFCTVVFQIVSLIILNNYDNRITKYERKVLASSKNDSLKNDDENPSETDVEKGITTDNVVTENPSNLDNTNQQSETNAVVLNTGEQTSDGVKPEEQLLEQTEENLHAAFDNSLFIGDSRFEGMMKHTPLMLYTDVCCDIGMHISDVKNKKINIDGNDLDVMAAIALKQYQKVFINLGFNELGWDYVSVYINDYLEVINDILNISPNTQIYVLSIIPVNNRDFQLEAYENNERVAEFNKALEDMCQMDRVNLIDINNAFIDSEGFLFKESSLDGIHFIPEYYKKYLHRLMDYMLTKHP